MRLGTALLVVALLLVAGSSNATLFTPGAWSAFSDHPDDGVLDEAPAWVTGAPTGPYQRDVYIDFTGYSGGTPDTTIGYGGLNDAALSAGDSWSLPVTDPANTLAWYTPAKGRNGVIGINNTNSTGTRYGYFDFSLANLSDTGPGTSKNVWLEYEYYIDQPGQGVTISIERLGVGDPSVFTPAYYASTAMETANGGQWYRTHNFWLIEPNPLSEDFRVSFNVTGGQKAFVDQIHVATECNTGSSVPEPASMGLLALAVGGIGAALKRRRSSK